jgi:hypothetical protein
VVSPCVLSRQNFSCPSLRSCLNPRLFILLRSLCRSQKESTPLQSSKSSLFCQNTRGGGTERTYGTPSVVHPQDAEWVSASTFRINTCKSVSKQTTLSSFRINTYEKPREGVTYKCRLRDRKRKQQIPHGRLRRPWLGSVLATDSIAIGHGSG